MNDYKELIERLNRSGLSNGATLGHHSALYDEAAAPEAAAPFCHCGAKMDEVNE